MEPGGLGDPLHEPVGPDTAWHTANIAEAIPGVPTPLGWTFWFEGLELGLRSAAAGLGVLSRREVRIEPTPDRRACAIVYGRPAANVDFLRAIADRVPGSSGEALERSFLGAGRTEVVSQPTRRRYPAIALRIPWALLRVPRRARRALADSDAWWHSALAAGPRPEEALRWFEEARVRFREAQTLQGQIGMLCPPHFDAVAALARNAGCPGSEMVLATREGGVIEVEELAALWEVSRGRVRLEDFLSAHGYHAPDEGELSSHSWREDPRPLQNVLATYSGLGEDAAPLAVLDRQAQARARAEAELLAGLSSSRRAWARAVLAAARRFLAQRQVGKASFLRVIDVARAAARSHGELFVRRGVLEDPEDVFFLTVSELRDPPKAAREAAAHRRERRAHYLALEMPEHWVGVPTPMQRPVSTGISIEAVGAGPGIAEGPVRVAADLVAASELQPGEILVCRHSDPGWASLLVVAAAFVVEVGGRLSHAAIVARELGTPCVVSARDATKRLRTGDRVRVDGGAGTVEILARASEASTARPG